jgi:chemosensory pili system protein ChpA (sensor histidine kinase/response regulator)
MSLGLRINLLTLVRQQIELNLQQAADAAARHATSADNSTLMPSVALLHQVSGALRMVQLPGAARFAGEIETAVKTALRGTPADPTEIALAGRAAGALRGFINDVAGGGAYAPLHLFPAYRELARLSGNDAASEKDLFFPEAHDETPVHATPRAITPGVFPVLLKDLRARYQRGLLAWLKESANPDGLAQMRNVLDQLHQITAQLPEPRSLWWAAVTLIEGIMEVLPAPHAAEWIAKVKPVCSRIDFLLRDLTVNAQANTALVQRDVYYAIASCRLTTPRLREAQRVLHLENLMPERRMAEGAELNHQPMLDDARARFENIKEVWTEYVAGEPRRLSRFRELLAPLTQKSRELGNLPLLQLLLAVTSATPQLPDPYPLDGQAMSLEMASALLMAENIVTHFNQLPPDLEKQVEIMKRWLANAASGEVSTTPPPGLRADIVQKANDEKLRIATAREILKSLQQIERSVEAYALDASKRSMLTPHIITLRQVRGVFSVSNQKRAARLATACQHLLERCAAAPTLTPGTQHQIEWLAEGLGSLGFYLEPCLHGKEPAERAVNIFFARYENQQGFEALLALSQQVPTVKPDVAPAAPAAPVEPVAPAPAPVAAQAAVDREMVDIFLEEANEVLATMETHIAQARHRPGDHDTLINVRRAFHTLKGSARMVGLNAFGECAWDMEQVMNHWLAQAQPATQELFNLCDDARGLLAEWAHELQGETTPAVDASGIAQRARALRGETPASVSSASTPSGATASAPLASSPPAAAVVTSEAINQRESTAQRSMAMTTVRMAVPAPVQATDTAVQVAMRAAGVAAAAQAPAAVAVAAPAYQQTLGDLGDRLSWLQGLVEEIQTTTAGTAGSRTAEIAQMMGESLSEVLNLHRELREKLDAHSKGKA